MKKSIALVALAFSVTGAFAQDLTSKKGEPFLPEAGEWSVGIDATPFLNYFGNFFGKTGPNVAPTWNNYSLNQTITGKKMKDANTAYRATIRIGLNNQKNKNAVSEFVAPSAGDVGALSEAPEQKFDVRRASTRNIVLGVGLEKRRGKTRLQGIYGADLLIWGGNTRETFKYGNDLTQTDDAATAFNENLDPTNGTYSTDWNAVNPAYASNVTGTITGYSQVDNARALKRKTNGVIGVGVRAFVGVEYFVAPKVSIGGEFGWGVGYQLNTKNKATWDAEGTGTAAGATQETKEIKTKDATNGGGQFIIDTDRNAINSATYNLIGGSGTLRLNFYF
jgi:hypothetical protein